MKQVSPQFYLLLVMAWMFTCFYDSHVAAPAFFLLMFCLVDSVLEGSAHIVAMCAIWSGVTLSISFFSKSIGMKCICGVMFLILLWCMYLGFWHAGYRPEFITSIPFAVASVLYLWKWIKIVRELPEKFQISLKQYTRSAIHLFK